MAKTTKARPTKAGTDYRQVRAQRLMDAFDEALGDSADVNLSFILEAESEVSRWLEAKSRRPAEPLQFEDLAAVVRETTHGVLSTRFSATLWALRRALRPGEPSVAASGALVLDTDAPLSTRLPSIVKVLRVTTPSRKELTRMLAEVSKALTESAIRVSPAIRAEAFFATIEAKRAPWRTRPWSKPATAEEIAESFGATPETFAQWLKRERRRARAAGLSAPRGKPGRPRKSGQ